MLKEKLPWGSLAYTKCGEGKNTLLLVHNAGGDHTMMNGIKMFFKNHFKVISVDLRGHGKSITSEGEFKVKDLASDLFHLCSALNLQNIILIGLNYGATLGIALDQTHPNFLSRLILIEPPIFMDNQVLEALQRHIEDLRNTSIEIYVKNLIEEILPKGSKEYKKIAFEAFMNAPRSVQSSIYKNLIFWDTQAKDSFHTSKTNTLLVQSKHPLFNLEKLNTYYKTLLVKKTTSQGPWIQFECEKQLNEMIFLFLNS